MSLVKILLGQCSKPRGWHGRITLRNMNRGHAELTAWGLKHLSVQSRDTILDVGCGGGVTVARLAAMAPEGKTYGIDYSAESVAASRKENQARIALGQVEILLGSVSHLPFPDRMFDLVTAVETHYFWPDLITDAREILRVLKPDGTFALIAEAYKGGKYDERLSKLDKLRGELKFAHLSIAEHRDMFSKAGFADIQIIEDYERGWVCVVGRRSG
jgi:SAM-dependent methyltransferase